jgi:O-acetyl-ADP-ribose deacetylase (regulator of RNase III)
MSDRLAIIQGDITEQHVDAIVNAANASLLGGGGVDGAIHRVAGPKLLEECRKLNGCETGDAKITKGCNLAAHWVIHTVGPIWNGGHHDEDQLLTHCYERSLSLASSHEIGTLAFPSISTGAYGFPIERAARIALRTIGEYFAQHAVPHKVVIVCFSQHDLLVYTNARKELNNARA